MVLDPEILAPARFEDDLEVAQVHLFLDAVGFVGRQAAHASNQIEKARLVQIGILVMLLLDGAVHQRHARRIGHAVVGGLVRLRPPLVRAVRHHVNGNARHPDIHLRDLAYVGEERTRFYRRLRHGL